MSQVSRAICTECGCEDIRQMDLKPYEITCNNCGGRHYVSVDSDEGRTERLRKFYRQQMENTVKI